MNMSKFNYISSSSTYSILKHPHYEDEILISDASNNLIVNNSKTEISNNLINPIMHYLNSSSNKSTLHADTGIVPPGLVHVDNKLVIFERPPTYQNVQLIPAVVDNINYENSKNYIFRLPIPWTVYFVSYSVYNGIHYPNQIAMYFMANSLQGTDFSSHPLYLPPLVNFYNNATLCNPMFDSMDEITRYENNVSGIINAAYNWIWNSGSNLDLTMNIAECLFQIHKNPNFSTNPFYDLPGAIHPFTYYTDFSYISRAFQNWEKISINDISSIPWPNPCISERVHSEIQSIGTEKLLDYFEYYGIDPDEVTVSEEEYRETGNMYVFNEIKYYKYLRQLQSSPLYFDEAAERFMANSQTNFDSSVSFDKIVSDVFLSLSSLI